MTDVEALPYPDKDTYPCLRRSPKGDIVLVSAVVPGTLMHHVTFLTLNKELPDSEQLVGRSFQLDKATLESRYLPLHKGYTIQIVNA